MTQYQVWGYLSARAQPAFDAEPVGMAAIEDLDYTLVREYVKRIRRLHPRRLRGASTDDEALMALHIAA